MKLIDADALANYIDFGHLINPNEKSYSENDIREMIDEMPTVEAIPVDQIRQEIQSRRSKGQHLVAEAMEAILEIWTENQ